MDNDPPHHIDVFPTLFVAPGVADYGQKAGGGGGARMAADVVEQARTRLLRDLDVIQKRLDGSSQQLALASLKLRGDNLAKSKRPRKLFDADTYPIIGDWGDPGNILLLVNPEGGAPLTKRVANLRGREAENLVNVESISLIERRWRLPRRVRQALQQDLVSSGVAHIKVRALQHDLWGFISEAQVSSSLSDITGNPQRPYLRFDPFGIYGVTIRSVEQLEQVASLWFVAAMEVMPTFVATDLMPEDTNLDQATLDTTIDFDQLRTVLVFDGGVDVGGPLAPLVYATEQFEEDDFLDFAHGTAVAAQVARRLDSPNGTIIPRARLIDVRGVPKKHSGHVLTEDVLVERLEYCAERYGHIASEWNLSFAQRPGPQRKTFSDIAMYLDNLHKRFSITFFCSPGNCEPRIWPPSGATDDFVAAPGDSVCAITVGSSAQVDSPADANAPDGAPSPFSPRGPVAYSVVKPDLIAPGGNVTGKQAIGVPVLGLGGQWTTNAGTSFSTPSVAGTGAELASFLSAGRILNHYAQEEVGRANLGLLMRALLTHRAHLAEVGLLTGDAPVDDYRGFGELPSLEEMLLDPFWRSTSVVYTRLRPKQSLILDHFPFPDSLRKRNLYWGHAVVTMASEPLLDPAFAYEYLRSNVDVHFGIVEYQEKVDTQADGSEVRRVVPEFSSQVHSTLKTPRNEPRLIQEEHKWSNVKKYESAPMFRCIGDFWRLKTELLLRDRESDAFDAGRLTPDELSVDVALVVTLDDPQRSAPVNSEVFAGWQLRGQIPAVVQMQPRIPLKWE